MAIRILIDTNVWLDLAKDYRLGPVIDALHELIKMKTVELIMPKIVREEFDRNKARVLEESKQGLASHFRRVREAVALFGDEGKRDQIMGLLNEVSHKMVITGDASKVTFDGVETLMAYGVHLVASSDVMAKAAERGLAKMAPFHLAKNSTADAILIEIYASLLNEDEDSEFVFITGNTRDFSQHNGDQRLPHSDIEDLFRGRSRYATSIVEVIRSIDEDLLEGYEWERSLQFEPRRLSEILEAEHMLFQQVWYNRHWGLRNQVENGEMRIITREEFAKLDGYHPEVVTDEIWAGALAAAKRTEDELGPDNIGPWDDFEWGMINGKLSALRWVTGDEWDMLDT